MKLLLTTNGRLHKNKAGEYYTEMVYGYSFFQRYFEVFNQIRLVAHVQESDSDLSDMLRVDGPNLEIYDVPFPHGKIQYIKQYGAIKKRLLGAAAGCDVAIFRIPDQLAFQAMPISIKAGLPVGIEVTSSSWEFFGPGSTVGIFRPILRILWDRQQKKACEIADASCYVTSYAIQKRYRPSSKGGSFSTYCSDVDINPFRTEARNFGTEPLKTLRILHVAGSLSGRAKGHGELLRAMVLLKKMGKEVSCVLVGGGQLNEGNRRLIQEKQLVVETVGLKTSDEIAEIMRKSDMFVFPSYREGLPRVVVEAMAAGLVCVATELDGTQELLDSQMLVPIRNQVALADCILQLMEHPEQMSAQSVRNVKVADEYSPEKILERRSTFLRFLRRKAEQT